VRISAVLEPTPNADRLSFLSHLLQLLSAFFLSLRCTCNTGFSGLDGGACTEWVAGKHKIAPRNAACSNCLAGQYSTDVGATSDVCQQCPPNSKAPEASEEVVDCSCKVGSSGQDGGVCTKCVANSFKADSGDANCISCPANSNSPEGTAMCKCNAGFSGLNTNSMCTECVSGKSNAIVVNASCPNLHMQYGVMGDSARVAGQALSGSESCHACEISYYSIVRAVTSETSCKSCLLNEMTVSVSSASPDDCDCIEGFSWDRRLRLY